MRHARAPPNALFATRYYHIVPSVRLCLLFAVCCCTVLPYLKCHCPAASHTATAAACPNHRRRLHATPLPLSCQHRRLLFARAAKRRSAAPHLLAKGRYRQYRGLAYVIAGTSPGCPPRRQLAGVIMTRLRPQWCGVAVSAATLPPLSLRSGLCRCTRHELSAAACRRPRCHTNAQRTASNGIAHCSNRSRVPRPKAQAVNHPVARPAPRLCC